MRWIALALTIQAAGFASAPAMSAETPASSCKERQWRLAAAYVEADVVARQAEHAIRGATRMARFSNPNYLILLDQIKEVASKMDRIVALAEQTIADINEFQKACPDDFRESGRTYWGMKGEMRIHLRLYKEP